MDRLGVTLGHFRITLGTLGGYSRVTLGSLLDHFGITLVSLLEHFRSTLRYGPNSESLFGTLLTTFGTLLERLALLEHFWSTLGALSHRPPGTAVQAEHFLNTFGTLLEQFWSNLGNGFWAPKMGEHLSSTF